MLDSHSCDADVTAQKKILAFPPIAARPLFSRLATGQSFRNVMPEMFQATSYVVPDESGSLASCDTFSAALTDGASTGTGAG